MVSPTPPQPPEIPDEISQRRNSAVDSRATAISSNVKNALKIILADIAELETKKKKYLSLLSSLLYFLFLTFSSFFTILFFLFLHKNYKKLKVENEHRGG